MQPLLAISRSSQLDCLISFYLQGKGIRVVTFSALLAWITGVRTQHKRNCCHLAGIIPPRSIFMALWPFQQRKAGNQSKACPSKSHIHVDFTTLISHSPRACQQHHISFGASCSMLQPSCVTCSHRLQINLWSKVLHHGSKFCWQFSGPFELEIHGCKCASIS